MDRPDIQWTPDDENPAILCAEIGRFCLRVKDGDPADLEIVIPGLENAIPDSWLKGTAPTLEDAKYAAIELVPIILAKVTGWLYEGAPVWAVQAMQPPAPVVIETAAEKAELCRRLQEQRGVHMDPSLVARVVELKPSVEGDMIRDRGPESIVAYYCPHDHRLRELRPRPQSTWIHDKSGRSYQIIGIGRFQSDYRPLDMAEVVLYGNPGNPLIWGRPLDEFMDGRFSVPPEAMVSEVDVSNRPEGVTLSLVLETDDNLVTGDEGMICSKCGSQVGTYHGFECEASKAE